MTRALMLRGIPLEVHDSEDLSNAIVRDGDFWEADILDYMAKYHVNHGTILDVGANIGNHTVYFANYLKYGAIMAFEPDAQNYELLKFNTASYKNIGLANFAVSDHTGTVYLGRNPNNWGAHEISETGDEVHCISLDKIALNQVTLIKIDVEKHEPQVLDGATDTILRCRPLILIEDVSVEYHRILIPLGYEIEQHWEHHGTFLWRPV
jgi:FkbM family methyltransferase